MHPLASGKALLAALGEQELEPVFRRDETRQLHPSTVSSEGRMRKELDEVRKTGFARTDEEYSLGITGIGRVVTIGGEVVGALSVAIPKVRYDAALEKRALDLLQRTAGLLEAS